MAQVTRHVRLARGDVFNALIRPETYPEWLVGCREIRDVDPEWPAVGSRFHHRVGLIGPLTIPDSSSILRIEPEHLLSLEVRARPFIRAQATFVLEDEGETDGQAVTRITLDEMALPPLTPLQPVLDPLVATRNIASLNALVAFLNTPAHSRSQNRSQAAKSPAN